MHLLACDSSKREQPKRKQTGNLRSPLGTDGGLTQRKAARPTLGGGTSEKEPGEHSEPFMAWKYQSENTNIHSSTEELQEPGGPGLDVHALTHQPVLAAGFPQHLHSKAPGTNAEGGS